MKRIFPGTCLAILLLTFGCSSEMAKRSAYESMQNKAQMDCQQRPGAACPEQKSYDEYQRSLKNQSEPGK
jgi:hypothetical protein